MIPRFDAETARRILSECWNTRGDACCLEGCCNADPTKPLTSLGQESAQKAYRGGCCAGGAWNQCPPPLEMLSPIEVVNCSALHHGRPDRLVKNSTCPREQQTWQ